MLIHEMTLEECRNFLTQTSLARLACDMDGQPYVVPVYLVYDGNYLFGFATMGHKIDCMRANPLVCVEVEDIKSYNRWTTVLVQGHYEELPDIPEYAPMRTHAYGLLQTRAMWWEPAYVAVEHRNYPGSVTPIFYRIHLDQMTGHCASPDPAAAQPSSPAKDSNWLSRLLDHVLPK